MKDKIHLVSDMAFEAVDLDNSNELEKEELAKVLRDVAKSMKINPPTENDVQAVLGELDADGDGSVSKEEFRVLIESVLEKMKESELEL